MSKEAMKLALEALEGMAQDLGKFPGEVPAIVALREALAEQPAPRVVDCHATGVCVQSGLRAEQPAQQEPVAWVYPEGLEALKAGKPWTAYGTRQEPNNTALYLSPQPDIAPYAWVTFTPYGDEDDVWYENPEGKLIEGWTYKPLYDTTPPAQRTWVDLTDDEIKKEFHPLHATGLQFARAVLAKSKEKNT